MQLIYYDHHHHRIEKNTFKTSHKTTRNGHNLGQFGSFASQIVGNRNNHSCARWIAIVFDQHDIVCVKLGNHWSLFCHQSDDITAFHLAFDCDQHLVAQLAVMNFGILFVDVDAFDLFALSHGFTTQF